MPERNDHNEPPPFNPLDPVGEVVKSLDKSPIARPDFPPDTPIIIVPNEESLQNLARPIVVADRAGYDKMRTVLEAGGLI